MKSIVHNFFPMEPFPPLVALLGPTASGKTSLALALAQKIGAEILSVDSRQVYRGMDIGTGKDLHLYQQAEPPVAVHLLDICQAGEEFNLYRFVQAFYQVLPQVVARPAIPLLCGGTGLYAEAILRNYSVVPIEENPALRARLQSYTQERRVALLARLQPLHNTTDTQDPQRTIRAIEVALAKRRGYPKYNNLPPSQPVPAVTFVLNVPAEYRRKAINQRLHERLQQGLIQEVEILLAQGVSSHQLIAYGLEYRYVTRYLLGDFTRTTMIEKLQIAIHQFAKRQMTYFRGMQRRGVPLVWIDGLLPRQEQLRQMIHYVRTSALFPTV